MDFSHSLIASTQILSFLKIRKFNTLTLQAPTLQNGQTLKQFVGFLPTNCLSVFGHFFGVDA